MPPCQYILIVAYDGTRFHGFQRQHNGSQIKVEGIKKRPRTDETGARLPLLTVDQKSVTVQDCLEVAILQWLATTTLESKSDNNEKKDENNSKSKKKKELTKDWNPVASHWSLEELNLRVAGRTDKGVHAKGQVVAIQLPLEIPTDDLWTMHKGIHSRLPIDISIRRILRHTPAENNDNNQLLFDPRNHVALKQYSYTIKYQRKPAIDADVPQVGAQTMRLALEDSPCLWICQDVLDDSLIPSVCQKLTGTHDYSPFVHKRARNDQDNTLTISKIQFEILQEYTLPSLFLQEEGPSFQPEIVLGRFIVEGQRFRRTMVRNLVGFVVQLCKRQSTKEAAGSMDWDALWSGQSHATQYIHSAPPTGLCLEFVKY